MMGIKFRCRNYNQPYSLENLLWSYIIYGEATVGWLQKLVGKGGNPFVGAVASSEVQNSCPVIGEIFSKKTACTGRCFGEVQARVH
jgi:hypothetical protein